MSLFGRKKAAKRDGGTKGQDDVPEIERGGAKGHGKRDRKQRKARRRHGADTMASVLSEAVQDECLDVFRQNRRFDFMRDGVLTHVGWGLNVEDIGGLSKKDAKDRSKGAIIEAINSNRISAMTTSELMDAGILLLIPNEGTLEAADEFVLLVNAPYRTFFVSDDGQTVDDDNAVEVSFADARDVLDGDVSITDLLCDHGYTPLMEDVNGNPGSSGPIEVQPGMTADADPEETSTMQPVEMPTRVQDDYAEPAPAQDDFDDLDDAIDEAIDEAEPAPAPMPAPAEPDPEPEPAPADPEPAPQPAPQPQGQDADPQPQGTDETNDEDASDVIDAAAYVNIVSKSLWDPADLQLQLDTTPFEQRFAVPSQAFTPFAEDRGDGPFESYLGQLSREANTDMMHEHEKNVGVLRQRYMKLVLHYISQLVSYYDLVNGESPYAKAIEDVNDVYNADIQRVDDDMGIEEQRIKQSYEERREHWAEGEKAKWIQSYDQEHIGEVQDQIARVRARKVEAIEADYNKNRSQVLEDRKTEAEKRLDYGVTEILAALNDDYRKMAVHEQQTYEAHRRRIQEWIEDNRQDAVAYAAELRESNRQQQLADKVREEWQGYLDDAQGDFDRKLKSMRLDLENERRASQARIDEITRDRDRVAKDAGEQKRQLEERIDDLIKQMGELDEKKAKEYEGKLEDARRKADEAEARYEDQKHSARQLGTFWIVILVIVAVAALCLGALFGVVHGIDMAKVATGAIGDATSAVAGLLPAA